MYFRTFFQLLARKHIPEKSQFYPGVNKYSGICNRALAMFEIAILNLVYRDRTRNSLRAPKLVKVCNRLTTDERVIAVYISRIDLLIPHVFINREIEQVGVDARRNLA